MMNPPCHAMRDIPPFSKGGVVVPACVAPLVKGGKKCEAVQGGFIKIKVDIYFVLCYT